MSNHLYPVPDNSRTPWCFLVLETNSGSDTPRITGWELTLANASDIVETVEQFDLDSDEQAILASLMENLRQYQYDGTILHTFHKTTLKLLRYRLFATESKKSASLHGFRHVALREVIDVFGPWGQNILAVVGVVEEMEPTLSVSSSLTAEDLWKIRCRVAPFVPLEILEGNQL